MIVGVRTRLPSRIVRRAAYERLCQTGMDYLVWVETMFNRFMREKDYTRRSPEIHHEFDAWIHKK